MGIGFDRVPEPAPRDSGAAEVLVLVNRMPHKRADLAVGYLDRWSAETGFVGTIHWVGSLPEGLSLPKRERWVLHPRIPDEAYQALLNRVRCVVYTTEYEGFGMPPVEAVLAGACPVYSDVEATREVMEGAGCPFQNRSYESFSNAMNRALAVGSDRLGVWRDHLQQRHAWHLVADRVVEAMSAET
jgi:glycosyltransferase involved in cell wall biosynthesis